MIYGIGTDIVPIDRIARILARHGDRFLRRTFTPAEIARGGLCHTPHQVAAHFAKRFAAKEAYAKALGTGIRDGVTLRDIGVENDGLGRPSLVVHRKAQQMLHDLMRDGHSPILHLSLSDSDTAAQAFVMIEGRQTP
ncbi:MAG: holo-ACP synthase [Pseudomonadota bacterium]